MQALGGGISELYYPVETSTDFFLITFVELLADRFQSAYCVPKQVMGHVVNGLA
jgi:hypothetical protein